MSKGIENIQEPLNLKDVIDLLILHPNLTSKGWVKAQLGESIEHLCDAGIIDRGDKKLALSTAGNNKYLEADAEKGAMIAVVEAVRKLVCSGAIPLGLSADFNFGNAQDSNVSETFQKALSGIKAAISKLGVKVASEDLVFDQRNINADASVSISAIGEIEDNNLLLSLPFKNKGDLIFMVGKGEDDMSSSDYLSSYHGIEKAPAPHMDLEKEIALYDTIKNLNAAGILQSCHSIGNGGLLMSLFEKSIFSSLGFDITLPIEFRRDAFLFGESQSRAVISVNEADHDLLIDMLDQHSAPVLMLGHVTKGEMRIDHESYGYVDEIKPEYEKALADTLKF